MPNGHDNPTPEEAERILRELAGGISPDDEINPLPTPMGPTGELYQTLLEQIPAVTFMTSFEEGKQNVYVSPQITEILGYTPEEWLATPSLWQERLHPDDKERFQEEFSKTVMSRGTAVHSVYRFVHRDGRVVWIQGDVRIKRDERMGFPLFVQAVGIDVTKLEEAKQREVDVERQRNARLQSVVDRELGPEHIVGSSEPIRELRNLIRKVAASDVNVLIIGESGAGKELVASAIHNSSARSQKEIVELNCAAIPESLLESELFGVKGRRITGVEEHAGKFEHAHQSTLFLDEIGDMPLGMQAKVLKIIEDRSFYRLGGDKKIFVDVRVICATNKDLDEAIRNKEFRSELYFRIRTVVLKVPSLRERISDVPHLAEHFLAQANRTEKRFVRISDMALHALKNYSWPGNVRELRDAILGAVVMCDGDVILPDHLPPSVAGRRPEPTAPAVQVKYYEALEKLEESLITQALSQCKGVKANAARYLSLGIGTLMNRMTYLGIVALKQAPWFEIH